MMRLPLLRVGGLGSAFLLLSACGTSHSPEDGSVDRDASTLMLMDAGPDAGTFDAGTFDAGTFDAGTFDAGTFDAGTDASTFDAGTDAGALMCSILGDHSLSIMGTPAYFRFRADGTWLVAFDAAALDTATMGGVYTYTGATFTIVDGAPGIMGSCDPSQVGTYTLSFDPTCTRADLTLVSDACTGRAMTLDGSVFARLR